MKKGWEYNVYLLYETSFYVLYVGAYSVGDFNEDGAVDVTDLLTFLSNYGACES